MLAAAWNVLYRARREGRLATTGLYGRLRHPQYVGFVLILFGFLLQWPTILTLAMFPVLVAMYAHLARREEQDMIARFGPEYRDYAARTPPFSPAGRRPAGYSTTKGALMKTLLAAAFFAFALCGTSALAGPDETQKQLIQRTQEAKQKAAAQAFPARSARSSCRST